MRKLLILILIALVVVPSVMARRKSKKAGEVENMVFTDSKYGYQLTLTDLWKYKVQKEDDDFRLVLTKSNYEIPADYLNAPDYTFIPKMVVFVGETKLSPKEFIDSLTNDDYKSDMKTEVLKEFEIFQTSGGSGMQKENMLQLGDRAIEIEGVRGVKWTGKVAYTNEVATSAAASGGKRVKGAYGGSVIALKKGNIMILFHIMSEWIYFENNVKDAMDIINSLKFEK